MNYFINAFKNYAVFSGRATRKEFWMFVLFHSIVVVVLSLIGGMMLGDNAGVLVGIYGLAAFIPYLALTVRRLHDTGKSGWWILISLVPFIGAIVLLVFLVTDSQPGNNQYGANPKGIAGVPTAPAQPMATPTAPTAPTAPNPPTV